MTAALALGELLAPLGLALGAVLYLIGWVAIHAHRHLIHAATGEPS